MQTAEQSSSDAGREGLQKRAVVVGLGPAGVLAASLLRQQGWKVDIFDKRDLQGVVGTLSKQRSWAIAVYQRGIKAVQKAFPETAGFFSDRKYRALAFHDRDGNLKGSLSRDGAALAHRSAVIAALLECLLAKHADEVNVHWEYRFSGVDFAAKTATFEPEPASGSTSGEPGPVMTLKYDLLIGADGASSNVRAALKEAYPDVVKCVVLSTSDGLNYKSYYMMPPVQQALNWDPPLPDSQQQQQHERAGEVLATGDKYVPPEGLSYHGFPSGKTPGVLVTGSFDIENYAFSGYVLSRQENLPPTVDAVAVAAATAARASASVATAAAAEGATTARASATAATAANPAHAAEGNAEGDSKKSDQEQKRDHVVAVGVGQDGEEEVEKSGAEEKSDPLQAWRQFVDEYLIPPLPEAWREQLVAQMACGPINRLPDVQRLTRFTVPGTCCVLIGDAAHTVTPTLGQGINSALEDASLLSDAIKGVKDTASLDKALQRFDKSRMPQIAAMQELELTMRVRSTPLFPRKPSNGKQALLNTMQGGAKDSAGNAKDSTGNTKDSSQASQANAKDSKANSNDSDNSAVSSSSSGGNNATNGSGSGSGAASRDNAADVFAISSGNQFWRKVRVKWYWNAKTALAKAIQAVVGKKLARKLPYSLRMPPMLEVQAGEVSYTTMLRIMDAYLLAGVAAAAGVAVVVGKAAVAAARHLKQ